MNIYYETSPTEFSKMTTEEIRSNFMVESVFQNDEVLLNYTHYDRMIFGGVMPVTKEIELENYAYLKSNFFLERREIGIINIGGSGQVMAAGTTYDVEKLGCVYLGKGTQDVSFKSLDSSNPAKFFVLSAPAHTSHLNQAYTKADASPVVLGDISTSNARTIFKYIHPGGIKSCQLVMGLTILNEGSIWNTMPPHIHDLRSEVYHYFDVKPNNGIMHFMGQPQSTRNMWIQNEQCIISPPWSIHAGAGSASYSFIWAMAGENQDFTDMEFVEPTKLK